MTALTAYTVSRTIADWLAVFLSIGAAALVIVLFSYAGKVLHRLGIDCIEIYNRFQTARLDLQSRRDLMAARLDPIAGAVMELESGLADLKVAQGDRLALVAAGRRLASRADRLMSAPEIGAYRIRTQWIKQAADEYWGNLLDGGLGGR